VRFKRVDLAIEAAAALEHAGRRAVVVVVGDGPDRARLERCASSSGARIRFVGAVPRTEALAWIAASDALVHASAAEAAPSAIREARALGVPVVATASGDVADWARDDGGIAIAAPSARAIAEAIASKLRAA
jgi:glycosyltransferase involved in cell wall biosynthesis